VLREGGALTEIAGFATFTILQPIYRGWLASTSGDHEPGIATIRASIAKWGKLFTTHHYALHADACLQAGRYQESMDAVAAGMANAQKTGEHHSESELERLAGESLMRSDLNDVAGAERYLRRAVATAVAQGAKLFELRATTSLARLLAHEGKRDEARAILADIYDWFTEGFDTADLKDAKALLDELGA
jgi:predicted ATPase